MLKISILIIRFYSAMMIDIFKKNGSEYDIHQLGLNSKHVVKRSTITKMVRQKGIRQQHMMS